ncbi:MAG: outer membrane lipoprotein-sorting protein [Spirochaetes bacterium]|nr:MAG: outer membrane lipoprotein-sorting protein [Spirochaetota bacterium]
MKKLFISIFIFFSPAAVLMGITPEEILERMLENQVHDTARIEGKMIIQDRFGKKTVTFVSWSRGEDNALIEFTSKYEAGQKILRNEDELYLYFPDAEEVIRLQGAALRQSVLGSDFSYEDMTGEKDLLDSYKVTLLGSEEVDGHDCYKLQLEAVSRNVPYPREILWVDKELFIYRKVHKFSLSGRLLKEMRITRFTRQNGKVIPVELLMEDKMKKNSSTEFIIQKIEIGIPIPEEKFSLRELTW